MKKLVSVVLFLFFSYFSYGQFCGFDVHRSELEKNPNFIAQEKASEQRIKLATQRIRAESQQRKSANQSTDLLTIPVVVHVLHLGEQEGTGTNISDAQIESSIAHLNSFYRGKTTGSTIDFQIEMKLAQRSPTCEITTGINRIDASDVEGYKEDGVSLRGDGASQSTLKQLSIWPTTDYLNIWIVSEIDGNNGGSGYQGYANFFNGGYQEGSVMMYTVFGYDPTTENTDWPLSRSRDNSTVVHELGHYFHLYHTFQGDDGATGGAYEAQCPINDNPSTDGDLCADTVPHKRETSSCPDENSCTSENWESDNTKKNIMSYYRCTDRMTADQKTRVRAVMEGSSIVNSKGSQQLNQPFVAPNAVCSTNSVSTWTSGILGVTLNGVTMTSSYSAGDDGNIDETSNCLNYFEIDGSVSYDLEVALSFYNFQQLGVWIDWNDDGDFEDANEQQYLDDDIPSESTVEISISYPENIPYNDYVRIRLICDLDDRHGVPQLTSPCTSSLNQGQSEDYTIYVKESSTASVAKNNVLNVSLHPNPAKNEVNISAKNTIESVTIYNVLGKKVSSYTVNATSKNLDIANLSSGIYVLKYLSSNAVGSLKFIKE